MTLVSKLSARWARIYGQPIDKLAYLQADFVNIAYAINPTSYEDYVTRRWLLKMSKASLQALEKRLMDMVRVLYLNPSKCFNRKNGKNYSFSEAKKMLDGRLEVLGVQFYRQYNLIKGVLEADKKKYSKLVKKDVDDKEIIEMMASKLIQIVFE